MTDGIFNSFATFIKMVGAVKMVMDNRQHPGGSCFCFWFFWSQLFAQMNLGWNADYTRKRYHDLRRSLNIIMVHCPRNRKGPFYRDRVPIGTFLAFWVPIYISGFLFSVFWVPIFPIFSVWFWVTLLANFDIFPCLRVKFYKTFIWVPILTSKRSFGTLSW